jgi:hypothetical protein
MHRMKCCSKSLASLKRTNKNLSRYTPSLAKGSLRNRIWSKWQDKITMLLDNKLDELPQRIGQEWKALQQKPVGQMDAKGKFKLKVPFIPGLLEYEKELSWDFKPLVKKIWSDLKAGKVFLE